MKRSLAAGLAALAYAFNVFIRSEVESAARIAEAVNLRGQ